MPVPALAVVFLFTDIEGSTRLWEQQPALMRRALAAHDAIARQVLARHRGTLVKATGDGIHAAFDDALDAVQAMLALQRALANPQATAGLPLALRCGLHRGADEARDQDYFGPDVNRAARIMAAAHGGQMLLSQVVADAVAQRLPDGTALRELGLVRLRDLSRPERLYQLLAPPLRGEFPALRSLEATPNNLVQQINRFIGRTQEVADLRHLLADNRLVTLFGTGGIGKSRLSVQLAAELLDDFPDGVWVVELAPQLDAQRVPLAVATVLGLKELPGQPLDDTLARFVRDKRMLIVLDNCEHVLAACAALAKRLLQAGAGLTVLASSREVLRVAGEAVYAVPALSVPASGAQAQADTLMQHEAVRLFVDRASSAAPAFRISASNAAAVAEICRRVDGVPLAIELAAARVRALPVQTIAARLRDSFALLATRDETVAPRQRTLRLLIDWSCDMLSPPERALYRRLAVFAGGFTLAAAEQVCAGDGLDEAEVIDTLTQLVEKSLLAMPAMSLPDDSGDAARYRMLETVRQHAAEQLVAVQGDAVALRLRHLGFCQALVQGAVPHLTGPAPARGLGQLDAEGENLLAALGWAAQPAGASAGDARAAAELGLQISYALRPYWINRGLLSLALDTTLAVLTSPAAARRDSLRARGLFAAGQLCTFMGRNADAMHHLGESLAITQQTGDSHKAAGLLQSMGIAASGLGDMAQARHCFEAAEVAARASNNPRQVAGAVNAVAQIDRLEGQLEQAHARYQDFLRLARQLGDAEYIAVGLLNLAMVAVSRQEAPAAARMLLEVMQIADDNGSRPATLAVLDVCAGLSALAGNWAQVARYYGVAEAQTRQVGLRRDAADEAFLAPTLDAARQALGEVEFANAAQGGASEHFSTIWAGLRGWLAGLAHALPADLPIDLPISLPISQPGSLPGNPPEDPPDDPAAVADASGQAPLRPKNHSLQTDRG